MATTSDVSEQNDPERFYRQRSAELVELAVQEFHIDAADARRLAHDVLVSSMLGARAANRRQWLAAAMRAAAGEFVRQRAAGRP